MIGKAPLRTMSCHVTVAPFDAFSLAHNSIHTLYYGGAAVERPLPRSHASARF